MSDEITALDLDAIEDRYPVGCHACGDTVETCDGFYYDHGACDASGKPVPEGVERRAPARIAALIAEMRRLRADNARLDDVAKGALDDLAKVRAELEDVRAEAVESERRLNAEISAMDARDEAYRALRGAPDGSDDLVALAEWRMAELADARAALRQYAPRCECGALATRTVGYDDCEPSTLRRVCDREACGRGLPVSGESAHAAAVRAAVLR